MKLIILPTGSLEDALQCLIPEGFLTYDYTDHIKPETWKYLENIFGGAGLDEDIVTDFLVLEDKIFPTMLASLLISQNGFYNRKRKIYDPYIFLEYNTDYLYNDNCDMILRIFADFYRNNQTSRELLFRTLKNISFKESKKK